MKRGIEITLEDGTLRTIYRIGLVGGQTAGKTTVLKRAEKKYGKRVWCVAEAATAVRLHRNQLGLDEAGARNVISEQQEIYTKQILDEVDALNWAGSTPGCEFILCDRTSLCGVAYLGIMDYGLAETEFLELTNRKKEQHYAAYDGIVFLEMPRPSGYTRAREHTSSYPTARDRSALIREAWKDHPDFHVVPWLPDKEAKIKNVFDVIDGILHRAKHPDHAPHQPFMTRPTPEP
jgi:hypothetical protein